MRTAVKTSVVSTMRRHLVRVRVRVRVRVGVGVGVRVRVGLGLELIWAEGRVRVSP